MTIFCQHSRRNLHRWLRMWNWFSLNLFIKLDVNCESFLACKCNNWSCIWWPDALPSTRTPHDIGEQFVSHCCCFRVHLVVLSITSGVMLYFLLLVIVQSVTQDRFGPASSVYRETRYAILGPYPSCEKYPHASCELFPLVELDTNEGPQNEMPR